VLALGLFACDSQQPLPPAGVGTLRVVSSLPQKGYAAPQSAQIEHAIDLATKERGSAVGTWRIEHVALDDSDVETGDWSPTLEVSNATRAAADPAVIAYIGPYNSGAVMLSLPITDRAGLLQISPTATWPGLTEPGWNDGEPEKYYPTGKHNFARMMPPDTVQAEAAAQWALKLNLQDVAVVDDGSSYSAGLAREFLQAAAAHTGLAGTTLTIAPPDLSTIATPHTGQAYFYAPSSAANALLVAQALAGIGATVLATDTALDAQFASAAANDAQNWYIVSNASLDSSLPAFGKFAQTFASEYGTAPGQFAANAYDATNLIIDAVARSGNDRAAVTAGVLDTTGYQGASGAVTLDPTTGNRSGWQVSGYQIVDGLFKQVTTLTSDALR
jgi:branched-chain amino acid transport system substrate-binding protein